MGSVQQQRHAQRQRHLNQKRAGGECGAIDNRLAKALVLCQQTLIIVQPLVFEDDPAAFFRADETAHALKAQKQRRASRIDGEHEEGQQKWRQKDIGDDLALIARPPVRYGSELARAYGDHQGTPVADKIMPSCASLKMQ